MYFSGTIFQKNREQKKNVTISDEPGVVYCREYLTSPEQACVLLKDGAVIPPVSVLPQKINPEGLSDECRNYLYREIRQFCKPGTEDLVAPVP